MLIKQGHNILFPYREIKQGNSDRPLTDLKTGSESDRLERISLSRLF
ncbi:MAG: hypothetical protein ACKO4S_13660 [Snowella sp.]